MLRLLDKINAFERKFSAKAYHPLLLLVRISLSLTHILHRHETTQSGADCIQNDKYDITYKLFKRALGVSYN